MTTGSLRQCSLFSAFSDEEMRELEAHAITRRYEKNVIIISEGDAADSLFVIEQGQLRVFVADQNGRELVLNQIGPGNYFGELALFSDGVRSASVMALEKTTLKTLSKRDFQAAIKAIPGMAQHLLHDLAFKVVMLTNNVRNMALLDVYGRVSTLLKSMAREKDGVWVVEEKITQQEIADRVGASRERVSHVLKTLRSGGYISFENGCWILAERLPHTF